MRRRMNHLLSIEKFLAISMTIMLALVILLSTSGSAMGQEDRVVPGRNVPTAPSQQLGPTDPAEMEAFLDEELGREMEKYHIAGAAVSVVKDGELFFAKGYGYADLENKIPVDPEQTIFRIGSVGKLFTWTAVMQLVEQGKLDLDRDVNDYLDYKIPEAFGKPITLKHILTHTAGFDEQVKDIFMTSGAGPDLGQYMKTHIPARVYPPGTVTSYSNYATSLAGYVVERVSGRPFGDYVAENIFRPLGMTRSTFAQPLPPDLAPLMSQGYRLASEGPKPFEVIGPFPAGSLS